MRIMLDTNVIISMIFFPRKHFSQLLNYITQYHELVLSSFVTEELIAVAQTKFPQKRCAVEQFLTNLNYDLVPTPHQMETGLFEIRDLNDYPILYTAIKENIDILITGDRDFADVIIKKPLILTPAEFIAKYL